MESREIVFNVKDGKLERCTDDKLRNRHGNKGVIACKMEKNTDSAQEKHEPSFWELYIKQCLFMKSNEYLEKIKKINDVSE
ncbi:hypothetical protein PV-S19_0171 [Pacmanvirus S19]|nr:hypothetical protein PV-S19_0171 [Pacmanvirus S19]